MSTAYIVDQAFPAELGVQMKPGQNWPGPIKYNGAVYRVVVKENLDSVDNNTVSTIAVYKTTDAGLTSTELDAAGEVFVQFLGNAYNDAAAYYPPEGGNKIYCAYQDPVEAEMRLIIFNLDTETWGAAITGGPSMDNFTTGTLSFVVRTTGEWIILFQGSGINYVSYNGGWGSPVFLQSGSNFTVLLESGRDASDNVVFYGQSSATVPGAIQARTLSPSNVLGAIHNVGLTFSVNQDNCAKPVYVPTTDQLVLAIAEIGGTNSNPGGVIHCLKSSPTDVSSFSLEVIQGAYTTNFDNGAGPANPLMIGALAGEQGQAWPRLALSADGLSLFCAYNLNDDSVAAFNTNSVILKTQVVGESTWDSGTTLFDTNSDTLVPDVHIAFGVDPATPVPAYRMGFGVASDGTQMFDFGTIARQPVEPPPGRIDDFGNCQFYFEVGGAPPTEISITCPLTNTATVGVPYSSGVPTVTGGTAPFTFSIVGGDASLPPGFTLDPTTGEISGTTFVAGVYSYALEVRDSGSPPLTAVVEAPCPITVSGSSGSLPCDNITPQPSTDVQFKLEKVIATMKPATHLPVRGSVT